MISFKNKLLFAFALLTTNLAFSQQPIDTIEIKIGRELRVFTNKVKIISIGTKKTVSLSDNNYQIDNTTQKAAIQIINKLVNGSLSITEKENERTDYTIKNSLVITMKIYEKDNLVFDSYQKENKAYYKKYRSDKTLASEAWVSLDEKKHFGVGVTKTYSKDGKLEQIDDRVAGTLTEYHPNGNKKSKNGQGVYEQYNENGIVYNKQYSKKNITYFDNYTNGKLYSSSYKNASQEEVTDYYKSGIFDKKEIIKEVKGEMFIKTYDKAGKLLNSKPQILPGRVSAVN